MDYLLKLIPAFSLLIVLTIARRILIKWWDMDAQIQSIWNAGITR